MTIIQAEQVIQDVLYILLNPHIRQSQNSITLSDLRISYMQNIIKCSKRRKIYFGDFSAINTPGVL